MKFETFPTVRLIDLALNEEDEEKRWDYITTLHLRGTEEVFEAAKNLCESGNSTKIALGADILGQLGVKGLPFKKESIPILLKLAGSKLKSSEDEDDIDALHSLVIALGKMEDDKTLRLVSGFKDHQDASVREAVAFGLAFVEEEFASKALMKLSEDSDEDVRNWATFGLGQRDADSKEIRDALFLRLDENESETGQEIRGEALVGLARRKDERVVAPLLKDLSSRQVGKLAVEAAAEIADKRFCETLLGLKDWWDIDKDLLNQAITNCCDSKDVILS